MQTNAWEVTLVVTIARPQTLHQIVIMICEEQRSDLIRKGDYTRLAIFDRESTEAKVAIPRLRRLLVSALLDRHPDLKLGYGRDAKSDTWEIYLQTGESIEEMKFELLDLANDVQKDFRYIQFRLCSEIVD